MTYDVDNQENKFSIAVMSQNQRSQQLDKIYQNLLDQNLEKFEENLFKYCDEHMQTNQNFISKMKAK